MSVDEEVSFPDLDVIPLTQTEELFLTALIDKSLYGLEIVKAIADASQGKRVIQVGTIYPTLHKLESKGLIISEWGEDRPEERGGARRRYYQHTTLGKALISHLQLFRLRLAAWKPEVSQSTLD